MPSDQKTAEEPTAGMLAAGIQRAVQVLVSRRVSIVLLSAIPALHLRVLVTCAAACLATLAPRISGASVLPILTLSLATSAVLSTVTDAASAGITLANLCMLLLAGEALVAARLIPSHVADAFLGNAKYLFGNAAATVLLSVGWPPTVPLLLAPCLAGISYYGHVPSPALAEALLNAALEIPRRLFFASLPPGIVRLPSVVAALCLIRPIYTHLGLLGPAYNFMLYSAADELSTALKMELGTPHAALALPALFMVSPTPAYRALTQIASVAVATDLVIDALQSATRVDPVPGLGAVLVLMEMILRLVG